MKKNTVAGALFLAILLAFGLYFLLSKKPIDPMPSQKLATQNEKATETTTKAKFLIFTNGTRRDFSDSRYHNLSDNLYINPQTPYEVVSLGSESTWADFFNTLPMKVDKNCLTTGTGQVFCSNETERLKFYINGDLDPQALIKRISNGDRLLISFGSEGEEEILFQLKELRNL